MRRRIYHIKCACALIMIVRLPQWAVLANHAPFQDRCSRTEGQERAGNVNRYILMISVLRYFIGHAFKLLKHCRL